MSVSLSVSAKVVTKPLKVNNYRFDSDKKLYRLDISGKAGAYFAPESLVPCLKESVEKKKPVELQFDVHTLIVKSCKI